MKRIVSGFRKMNPFEPALVGSLKQYSVEKLGADITAGVIVGIIALPLAMALGIASGVTPEAGLFTAIVAGFVISLLGGSRFQVSGPTGAFVVVIYSIVQNYGIGLLPLCTIMAGIILLLMGFCGLGKVIKFIPHPVTMGFTTGIAVVLLLGQIKDFLGLPIQNLPADSFGRIKVYLFNLKLLDPQSLGIGLLTLGILFFWPKKYLPKIPITLIALVIPTVLVYIFKLPVETIIDRFPSGIPQSLPKITVPVFSIKAFCDLISPAFTIALLGAMESLLSAVVADSLTDDRHNSNQELMGQGIGNIFSGFFGGIPATGAIARTAANIRSGAHSPVSGIVHAIVLLLIVLVASPLANLIPLTALSAVLIMVAVNMGEWHEFQRFKRVPISDFAVFITVFALTILAGITVAVEIGLVLAALLFSKRVADISNLSGLYEVSSILSNRENSLANVNLPEGVQAFRIQGAFFFGTADKLETALRRAQQDTRVTILMLDQVIDIDSTGLNALESFYERLVKTNSHLILCNVPSRPLRVLIRSGFICTIGKDHFAQSLDDAIIKAQALCKVEESFDTLPASAPENGKF
ncbi:MAG: hypothetical protein A2007_04400 [Verrucomicrobia bacterium GWC2_42_7]|nr:MAG: hypothetical protein A2007_04400 [Verrucomicrobia bacterium GWC2_42_7]